MSWILERLGLPILDVVKEVIKRVFPPEKMSEEARAKLEQELLLTMMSLDWASAEKEVEDRVSARVLAQEELKRGNALTNVLAALHRPTWSFAMLALFIVSVIDQFFGRQIEISIEQWDVFQTVLKFYFGGRTVEKVGREALAYLNRKNGNGTIPAPAEPPAKPGKPILQPRPFTSETGFRKEQ